MLELTQTQVAVWGRRIKVGDPRLAELDLRLVDLLARFAGDHELRRRLPLKGGTALNKLYFAEAARLSVDLDHNAVGSRDEVQGSRKRLRDHILNLFRAQDPAFVLAHDHSWEMLRVTGRYQPLSGGAPEKIKMEVAMVERTPVTRIVERPLETEGGTVRVPTYPVDELVATKWHAFYARSKGRDLYDLVTARPMVEDPDLVRKMALYYFLRAGVEFDPQRIRASIAEKRTNRAFAQDLNVYLRGDLRFETDVQLAGLEPSYAFMLQLDRVDREFVELSRHLLGKLGRARAGRLLAEKEPLRVLFDGHRVNPDVLKTPVDELIPFKVQAPTS